MAPGSSIASRTRSKSGLQTNTLIHIENNTKREKSIEIKVNKVQENAIKKRKKPEPESSRKKPSVIDLSVYSAIEATFPSQTKAKTLAKGINEEEKRMRLFRHKAPQSYKQRLSRAISQR